MEETDLTYEGIETRRLYFRYQAYRREEETDLTYEGIETRAFLCLYCTQAAGKKPT